MSDRLRPEIAQYIDNLSQQLVLEKQKSATIQAQMGQSTLTGGEKSQNIVELQLEVDKILDKIYHLLSGHEVKYDQSQQKEYWAEPEDDRLRIFSIYGVKRIMNLLAGDINTNTLMGYYETMEEVKKQVWSFGIELADLINNHYEHLVYYPSPEELYERYKSYIGKYDFTEKELYEKCIKWSEEELSNKENFLPSIYWSLVRMVYNTYTRPFRGKERTSLGERGITLNQNTNPQDTPLTPQKKGGFLSSLRG